MDLILQILLSIISLICILVGTDLLLKGVTHFLPKPVEPSANFDSVFRFLSAMFLSFGFLLIWIVFHIHEIQELVYCIGIVVVSAGLGRVYSRIKVGSGGKKQDKMMLLEIILGLSIIVLQYVR